MTNFLLNSGNVLVLFQKRETPVFSNGKKEKGNVGINTGFSGVHEDYRCMGIASSLKHTALKWAKKKNYPWIRTENDSTNKGMLGINIKAGFKPMTNWLFMSKVVKKI